MLLTYEGTSNFIVKSYNANNEELDLIVNKIGEYRGRKFLDIFEGQESTRFQIEASGKWEIRVLPFTGTNLTIVLNPTNGFDGTGDDIVVIGDGKWDLLKIDAKGKRNFIIHGWGKNSGRDLLVNEIAPYNGTIILPTGTYMFEIEATGPWHLEVTTK